jgi:hypothetical protein
MRLWLSRIVRADESRRFRNAASDVAQNPLIPGRQPRQFQMFRLLELGQVHVLCRLRRLLSLYPLRALSRLHGMPAQRGLRRLPRLYPPHRLRKLPCLGLPERVLRLLGLHLLPRLRGPCWQGISHPESAPRPQDILQDPEGAGLLGSIAETVFCGNGAVDDKFSPVNRPPRSARTRSIRIRSLATLPWLALS